MHETFWSNLESYLIVPLVILIAMAIYAITKWALKQKAVTSHQYLETMLSIVNETALSIATSLNKIPPGHTAQFNLIANDVINTAVDSIMSNFNKQATKAGLNKVSLHSLLKTSVTQKGVGTAIPLETQVKFKLTPNAILSVSDMNTLENSVLKDVQKTYKDDAAVFDVKQFDVKQFDAKPNTMNIYTTKGVPCSTHAKPASGDDKPHPEHEYKNDIVEACKLNIWEKKGVKYCSGTIKEVKKGFSPFPYEEEY